MIINLVLIKFRNTLKNLYMKKNRIFVKTIEKSSKVNFKLIIKNYMHGKKQLMNINNYNKKLMNFKNN